MNTISVIIPCYNQARYLSDAIESVRRQTHPDVEIIVIDDGSTDDTSAVASNYPEARCIRQKNSGLSAARNAGIRESGGDFLVFLDADDRLLARALEINLNVLLRRPECALTYGNCNLIDSTGAFFEVARQPTILSDHYRELLRDNYIITPAQVMYRRETVTEQNGFDTAVSPAADYDMYLRVARIHQICGHGQVIAEYRRHDANMTLDPALMLTATLKVHRAQLKHVAGVREYEEAHREGLRQWQEVFGEQLVGRVRARARRRAELGRMFWDALILLRHCPRVFARHARRKLFRSLSPVENHVDERESPL